MFFTLNIHWHQFKVCNPSQRHNVKTVLNSTSEWGWWKAESLYMKMKPFSGVAVFFSVEYFTQMTRCIKLFSFLTFIHVQMCCIMLLYMTYYCIAQGNVNVIAYICIKLLNEWSWNIYKLRCFITVFHDCFISSHDLVA